MAKAKLREIRLEPVSDKGSSGVLAHTTHVTKRSGQGGGPLEDYDTERTHHPTMESLTAHIREHMGSMFGEDSETKTVEAKEGGEGEY